MLQRILSVLVLAFASLVLSPPEEASARASNPTLSRGETQRLAALLSAPTCAHVAGSTSSRERTHGASPRAFVWIGARAFHAIAPFAARPNSWMLDRRAAIRRMCRRHDLPAGSSDPDDPSGSLRAEAFAT